MPTPHEFTVPTPGRNTRVSKRLVHEKLFGLDRKRTTVDELIRRAEDDGWIGFLGQLPCLTLRKLLSQPRSADQPASGISVTRRTILNHIFDHPWRSLETIASELALPEETVAQELEAFRSKQLLRTREEDGSTLYAPVV